MKKNEIFWAATAVKQRNHVLDYWDQRNKSKTYSEKLVIKINDRIKLLKTNP